MNIIQIATLLSVDVTQFGSLTKADFTEMESRLEQEKLNHSNLTDHSIAQFFKALKKHAQPFQAVMNNRALFNFFAQKNYSKKQFPTAVEVQDTTAIKAFIQTFLIEELNPFVLDKIQANEFQEIALLVEAHEFLPDEMANLIYFFAKEKLDLANRTLKPPFGDFSKILYVKDAHFFIFLNGLKNEELEEKIKLFFTTVMNMYMADKTSELAKQTFTAMKNYDALDDQLSKNIGTLKESAEINYKPFAVNRKKYYWIYAVVGLFILIRVSLFISDISEMNNQYDDYENYDDYETESEPRKLDRYYTDMKFKIDSFRTFLVDYNQDQIKRLTKISDIKTGQNPFETFYENQPTGESGNNIRIQNSSDYDMLLLENAVLYDSIKIPRTAHYIKAGDFLYVNFNSEEAKTIFNVYLGKKLATFQTESNHLFVRGGSVVEYRFSELAPRAKAILAEDHIFENDVKLNYKNGGLIED
ncbi:hypothetical protein HKT18_02125 [Flavobacterium sp. IMCC34852]|uniref:Uncharacterized protein n=1 Tax=Flavobacterium rivulicola TaxID=2732161 RepID=A0A7Y3R6V3_9FLAO|nr:hypothetical protein [Flavobacterium sp. IMCC34852]NNT71003.1 hypothetical protein [Flavobacterium sp. IMCC34852]